MQDLESFLFAPPPQIADLRDDGTLTSTDVNIIWPGAYSNVGDSFVTADGGCHRPSAHPYEYENRESVSATGDRLGDVVVMVINRPFVASFSLPIWVDRTQAGTSEYGPLIVERAYRFYGFTEEDALCH
jgi:hypothetical protein